MQILVVETDRLIRDQVKVGMQQFPEFTVTCGEGYAGINLVRQRDFDAVFLGIPHDHREARRMIEHLRAVRPQIDLIVMSPERIAKEVSADKQRYDIWSILQTPIDVTDFFRLIARVRERLGEEGTQEAPPSRSGRYPRHVSG